jgi:glycosyltransferase EpsD
MKNEVIQGHKIKILFVATVDQHIKHFHLPFIKWFSDQGYEIHVASNGLEVFTNVDYKYNFS